MSQELPLVLCLDDDLPMLSILSKILSRLPVECVATASPQEAIDLATRLRPRLLILDLMMPGMGGWEVLDKIRGKIQSSDLRVIILTAKDSSYERLVAANVARVDVYLTKPFDAGELARHVSRLCELPSAKDRPDAGGLG